jgi:hypothetical protein
MQSPYVKVTTMPSCTTEVDTPVNRGSNPEWGLDNGSQMLVLVGARDTILKLEVWNTNTYTPDDLVGFVEIDLDEALRPDEQATKTRVTSSYEVSNAIANYPILTADLLRCIVEYWRRGQMHAGSDYHDQPDDDEACCLVGCSGRKLF